MIPTESCSGRQHVKREPEFVRRMPLGHGHADRSDETGAFAIGDQLVDFLRWASLVSGRWRDPRAPAARPASAAPPFRNPLRLVFFESMGLSFEDELSRNQLFEPSGG